MTHDGLKLKKLGIFFLAIFPFIVMGFFSWNLREKSLDPALGLQPKNIAEKLGLLENDMRIWPSLDWRQKETAVYLVISYFRNKQNVAILKSPEHYVFLLNRLLKTDPSARQANLGVLLQRLAVMEKDFYSGKKADLKP